VPNLTLDAAADELYGGEPAAFVARRDELVKVARAAKDRPLAEAIKALRRPTVGAWYVNLASSGHLTALVDLLKLAHEVADAKASGDFKRLVALGPRRSDAERRVLSDLTAHLVTLSITPSQAALEEVRSTMRAALDDLDAAAAVASGRLAQGLAYGHSDALAPLAAALGIVDDQPEIEQEPEPAPLPEPEPVPDPEPEPVPDPEPQPVPEPEPTPAPQQPSTDARRAALKAARGRVRDAEDALSDREVELEEASRVLQVAQDAVRQAQAQLAAAQRQLDEASLPES